MWLANKKFLFTALLLIASHLHGKIYERLHLKDMREALDIVTEYIDENGQKKVTTTDMGGIALNASLIFTDEKKVGHIALIQLKKPVKLNYISVGYITVNDASASSDIVFNVRNIIEGDVVYIYATANSDDLKVTPPSASTQKPKQIPPKSSQATMSTVQDFTPISIPLAATKDDFIQKKTQPVKTIKKPNTNQKQQSVPLIKQPILAPTTPQQITNDGAQQCDISAFKNTQPLVSSLGFAINYGFTNNAKALFVEIMGYNQSSFPKDIKSSNKIYFNFNKDNSIGWTKGKRILSKDLPSDKIKRIEFGEDKKRLVVEFTTEKWDWCLSTKKANSMLKYDAIDLRDSYILRFNYE